MAPGHRKKTRALPTARTVVEDEAQLEPIAVGHQSPNSTTDSQLPMPPTGTNSTVAINKSKRGRGVARGFEVKKMLKSGGKIQGIIIDETKWLPVGPAEKIFKMEIGVVTRLLAPLRFFYWKDMTPTHKERIFKTLESEFEVNFDEPHARDVVDAVMGMRFRQFKHRCHSHYKKFRNQEEARQHPPVNVEGDDWIPLCEHFESENFKSRSEINKKNRSKLEFTHTSGSKSYSQRLYEMANSDITQEPSQVQLYRDTHCRKDGTWIHRQAQENYENMETLRVEGGAQKTQDHIREEVLGKKPGYARELGYGVKSSTSTPPGGAARIQAQRADEAEKRAQHLCDEVQQLRESQTRLQELVQTLLARLDGTNTSTSLHGNDV